MTSWRETASQQAQDDLDTLLTLTLPFAQQQLAEHGEFFPFAAAVGADGIPTLISADPSLGEHPASVDVLNQLVGGLQEQAGNLRAAALVADVRAGTSDAVRVELEHRDGQAIRALLPYKRKRLRRGIDYGELVAAPGSQRIWPGSEANPGF
jgi:hypothetical protein